MQPLPDRSLGVPFGGNMMSGRDTRIRLQLPAVWGFIGSGRQSRGARKTFQVLRTIDH
jgi:hypothetical protein